MRVRVHVCVCVSVCDQCSVGQGSVLNVYTHLMAIVAG